MSRAMWSSHFIRALVLGAPIARRCRRQPTATGRERNRLIPWSLVGLFAFTGLLLVPQIGLGVQLKYGDIVVPQGDDPSEIVVIDPSTGNREVLSRFSDVGTGPNIGPLSRIARQSSGDFLVVGGTQLAHVSASTGDRTLVASPYVGTGPMGFVSSVLTTNTDRVILVDQGGYVTELNPVSGNRTLISGLGVGTGFSFGNSLSPGEIDKNGNLIVYGNRHLISVNLNTGARTIVSGQTRGSGPEIGLSDVVLEVAILPDGVIVVETRHLNSFGTIPPYVNQLFRIDPLTGNRSILSIRQNPGIDEYYHLAVGINGQLLGAKAGTKEIIAINSLTGAETLISGPTRGSGPGFSYGEMFVVVPEPATLPISIAGFLTLVVLTTLKRRT